MIPTKEYIDTLNRLQEAINSDGPDGVGSPQTFDQAVVIRTAAMQETLRLTLHCLLEIREIMVMQAVATGLINQVAATVPKADDGAGEAAETTDEDRARWAASEAEQRQYGLAFDPGDPPAENTPAWYAWRHEMNARGFPAVPLDMVAQGLTEADLSDPAKIKERMEKLAGTMPP